MHPNPVFRSADHAKDIAFARARGFGTLCVSADPVPLLAHIPFTLNEAGDVAMLHLVRSNPIARRIDTHAPAKIAVMGPDSYISPDWYGVADQVPTWNYVAVHLTGRLTRQPQESMRAMLDHQSQAAETPLAPKPVWQTEKMTPEVLERMMRQIVPFHFHVEQIDATWKLGQNKPDAVRLAAADAVETDGIGQELAALAALMRDPPAL
ncbi:Protease synthase and sporulation protein PAI 2 [Roseivivax sp. THAF40]|uniref:FMN-binding negative transcriptional regulator n=1 Tax=unclassified Roseivivax TaxID=2639302 RepID=UPI0012694693|nr:MULTISPECIES: FMN-binding negative transcriptional regulator [unclassified Roseivivax]QFS84128.1 Protease synthase and sporulation protein PAI 2 [Roseivivax sp. THAF197b]QFT47955.1 Protease synthase and sporulation protein PAI 2 [Roseivivax sp. THAF40]